MGIVYKLGCYIEEIILAVLIFINILDFLEIITPEWDYIDKLVSWVALGYLLYRVSLTKLFFGEKHKIGDGALVIAYFLMIMKNLINAAQLSQTELLHKASELISFAETKLTAGMSYITIRVADLQHLTTADFSKEVMQNIFNGITLSNPEVVVHITDGKASRFLVTDVDSFLIPFINTVVKHAALIDKISFIMGGIILIGLSLYFGYRYTIKSPSLLHVIHEEGSLNKKWKYMVRALVIFIVLVGFFIIIFNLIMEWLGLAIDAPLLIIAIFTYLLLLLKHHDKFHPHSFIFKMGSLGESFYEHFITMFHSRQGLIFGVTGMLVLHLLTDVGNFLIPYLIHVHDRMYFDYLGAGHTIIFNFKELFTTQAHGLLISDLASASFPETMFIIGGYLLNIIAIVFLFVFPALIWYAIYRKESLKIPPAFQYLFLGGLVVFLVNPVFKIASIKTPGFIGVDILTRSVSSNITQLHISLLLALGLIIIVLICNMNNFFHNHIQHFLIIAAMIYFILYVYYFFMSYSSFFINAVISQFQIHSFFTGIFFLVFFMITILFYILGTGFFLWEIKKAAGRLL